MSVNGATLYTINLPQNKESWVAVDENFWIATLGFPDAELTDYRVFFMHGTPATIRFAADGPRQVKFMIMRDEANSIPVPPM